MLMKPNTEQSALLPVVLVPGRVLLEYSMWTRLFCRRARHQRVRRKSSMGIKSLFPFLSEAAPLAVKETKMEAMTGREIAIDAQSVASSTVHRSVVGFGPPFAHLEKSCLYPFRLYTAH